MKKRLLSLALVLVLALSLLPGAALAAPPGSYDVNGTTISVTRLGINVSASLTYLGDGVFRSSNESSSGITYISSLKDIKYYLYDFDGNLTWQYDGSMEVGERFSDGLCKMLMFDPYTGVEKWGFIDKYGNTVIDGQFDAAEDFSDGLAAVKKDGLWGYVNTSGKLVIPCEYLYVHDFGDGLAFVRTGDYKEYCIDKSGKVVFEVPKEPIQDMFGTIMTYGYSCIHPHRDGYAMMSNTTGKYEGVVLMDKKGNVTEIPGVDYTTGTWNTSGRFDSGRLPVRAGGHAGVADMDGNLIVPFIYDRIYSYSNGVAPARNDEGLWGLLDVNGNVAVPFEWSFMWEFDGNQLVAQHKSDYRFYLLEVGGTAQPAEPEPEPESWTLTFAGDCTIGTLNEWQGSAARNNMLYVIGDDYAYPFSGVIDLFENDDFTMVNLEGAFTDETEHRGKPYCFRASPDYAECLTLGSVEAVSLANNHSRDYHEQGLADTRAALEAEGVLYSDEDAPLIVELRGGLTLGVAAFNAVERDGVYAVGDVDGYMRAISDDYAVLDAAGCDIKLMFVHWGWEYRTAPEGWMTELAGRMAELGFDAVIGSHPHVLQRVEDMDGVPVFYSLGNFAYGGHSDPDDPDSAVLRLTVERGEDGVCAVAGCELVPCSISSTPGTNDFRPRVYTDEADIQRVLGKLGL